MIIGRSDDPRNPCRAEAFEAAYAFGCGSRNPSGPAAVVPHQQAGHTHAIDLDQIFLLLTPCTQGAVHTRPTRATQPTSVLRAG